MSTRFKFLTVILSLIFFGIGHPQDTDKRMPPKTMEPTHTLMSRMPEITKAVAVLHGTTGNSVEGIVTFTKEGGLVKIVADISGLKPGKHGFHIHEYGDCSSGDGMSAGGHFNPDNSMHGAPNSSMSHVGDLGNIEADKDGKAHLEMTDSSISFSGPHSIIGRGLIVHAAPDDLKSQPVGNAGARVACGVIGIAKP
ncbi:MAG TPA: superoxide dismutase family protein [Ignavibacteriaceae bacterium]